MSNRRTAIRVSLSALIAIVGLSLSMLTYAEGEENLNHDAAGGAGTIMIEQKNLSNEGTLGTWTLIKPGNEELEDASTGMTVENAPAGSYTLFAKAPDGSSVMLRVYRNAELTETLSRSQITFKVADGETVRISVNYILTKTGIISVQSDPSGIDFELSGPNDIKEFGVTPASFLAMPIGRYALQYLTPDGCVLPAPKSTQLKADGRESFDITIQCEITDKLRDRAEKKDDTFVVISVDGEDVTLHDVPQNAWFATYVYNAAKRNVLAGYKDASGKPDGRFGPGNDVTIAELAKIAHRLGSVSEEAFVGKNPENPNALGAWFSPFVASAEARGWTVWQDPTVDPLRPATRAEVVVTFLQILDVELPWQKGDMFTDVNVRTRHAAAIEKAAKDGIVSGRTDENGKPLNLFAPEDPINRAEIAKIINAIFETYKGIDEEKLSR